MKPKILISNFPVIMYRGFLVCFEECESTFYFEEAYDKFYEESEYELQYVAVMQIEEIEVLSAYEICFHVARSPLFSCDGFCIPNLRTTYCDTMVFCNRAPYGTVIPFARWKIAHSMVNKYLNKFT